MRTNVVQYLGKYKQGMVIEMRKRGFSYSEIENRLHVPKSTISYWLKNIKLAPEQIKRLDHKRVEIAKANALKKTSKTRRMIEEIKNASAQDLRKISKRELWLMGIVLYWKHGNKNDLKKGVHFSSADPDMIKLFLKWLRDVGRIGDKEIRFDLFVPNKKKKTVDDLVGYWSKVTGFSRNHFSGIYFQKFGGFLRVKVAQSSMLARQINGWVEGIKNITNSG